MAYKLYVGKLPYETTEEELRELFGRFGTVESVHLISDRETGRSRGFGFVEMSSEEEGQAAIKELNGSQMGRFTIVVNEARPKEPRPAY